MCIPVHLHKVLGIVRVDKCRRWIGAFEVDMVFNALVPNLQYREGIISKCER